MKKGIILIVVLAVLAGGYWYMKGGDEPAVDDNQGVAVGEPNGENADAVARIQTGFQNAPAPIRACLDRELGEETVTSIIDGTYTYTDVEIALVQEGLQTCINEIDVTAELEAAN